ncbi:8657_t:CDS:2, partial [Gigaspora rosea]
NENEQYEDEGTIKESINDDGAVDNDGADDNDNDSTSETIISSNHSNNCEEILRLPNQEIQTTSSNSCSRSQNKWTKKELNALEAGMEKYKTSWKKICEEYAVLCNRNLGQLKDKARNEKFRR